MSVLINMEMPTSCGFCLFEKHTDDGYECCINRCLTEYQKRPDDCPLVSVPPHGRLIDADAAACDGWKISMDRAVSLTQRVYETRRMTDENALPTIIPAEGGNAK